MSRRTAWKLCSQAGILSSAQRRRRGKGKKAVLRAAYETLVSAREAIAANAGVVVLGATLSAATAGHWEDTLIDAALKFESNDLSPEALIVSGSVLSRVK